MHHHTERSFVDEFRWVSTLHYLKKNDRSSSSLVHVASGAAIFTLLVRRRVAFLHRTATCRPLFKPRVVVNLQDNRAVFRIFIALLKFSFDSASYYIFCVYVCSLRYSACSAHASYCHLWPVLLCHYFPTKTGGFSGGKN